MDSSLTMQQLILGLLAIGLGWWVLSLYGIIGGNKAAKKAIDDKQRMQSIQTKRRIVNWILAFFENFAMQVGNGISLSKEAKYNFYIIRRQKMIKTLGRLWKPIELVGLFRIIGFVGVLITGLGLTRMSFNFAWFGFLTLFLAPMWEHTQESALTAEDAELELDFPDLYLLLNPKLQQGANARIATVLSDYLVSLELAYAKGEHMAIKKFVRLLRNNIELYSDEVLALQKQRSLYKSAVVINFCNIAIQAMNGVDNREKLISFEQELTRSKLDQMRRRAAKLVAKGEKAIMLVYIILFEFVFISMFSRLSGSIDGFFNLM